MIPFVESLDQADFVRGELILIDKPQGWTSFDAVNQIKNLVRRKYDLKKFKVGHSGTLDPMATGLLVICTGQLTKALHGLQGLDKKYEAEITLGVETNTYDAEGETVFVKEVPSLDAAALKKVLLPFEGTFQQIPPAFSAIKKEGKPLYALARAGKEVRPEPRTVHTYQLEIAGIEREKIRLMIHCGSGFYVRSLAHDIGESLSCGAHLSSLRRLQVGPYSVRHAFTIEAIRDFFKL